MLRCYLGPCRLAGECVERFRGHAEVLPRPLQAGGGRGRYQFAPCRRLALGPTCVVALGLVRPLLALASAALSGGGPLLRAPLPRTCEKDRSMLQLHYYYPVGERHRFSLRRPIAE